MRTFFPKLIELKVSLGLLLIFSFCSFNSFSQSGYTCNQAIPLSPGTCGNYDNSGIIGTMTASCFSGVNNSMWFSFIADSVGIIITVDGGFPYNMGKSSVALFSNSGGCNGTFTEVPGGCDNPNNNTSTINYPGLTVGNTYYVLVDGRGAAGTFNICLRSYSEGIATLPYIISEVATNVTVCGGSDGTISIVASGGTGVYQYSINGGTTFFSNGGNFTDLPIGNYPVVIYDGNYTISGSTLVITDPGLIAAPVSGKDTTYCEGNALQNMTAIAGNGGTLTWYSDPGLNLIIGTGSTLMPLTATGTTNYYVTEMVGGCQSQSSVVAITIHPKVSHSISDVICTGNNYILGTQTLTASGTYTETFVAASGCDSVVTLDLSVVNVISTSVNAAICSGGAYTFGTQILNLSGTYTETFVSVGGCDSVVTLSLNVIPVFTDSISVAICLGNSYTLGTQILTASGTYTETFVSTGGCDSIVILTLFVDSIPVANAGVDVTICKGKEIVLTGSGGTNYNWQSSAEIISPNSSSPIVYPKENTSYTLTVSTNSGCSSTDTVTVYVKTDGDCKFHVYANFTPNNDNINDYWIIDGIELYGKIKLSIYNRWGDEVWKAENYNNADSVWTGKNKKSEDLPDGTYFYVINADEDVYQGVVEINR